MAAPDAQKSDGAGDLWSDIVHTGRGTLAGRYMRTFWQPVSRAEDLAPGRAKPIRVMGEDLTLYRGEDGPPPPPCVPLRAPGDAALDGLGRR